MEERFHHKGTKDTKAGSIGRRQWQGARANGMEGMYRV
jgi:hypothetical protein